ncbi:SRPBCC family protein [Vineibacter terrae]|uniref:SRPBCC family protein n=1 Tax=Vineibacter terrae TaxID=2586908 RepID=UPI002E31556C|nr:SRPBCC family protein [Vineibacter terrae]HEX2887493.1 SRPBCC family protein [Vineibacter terrae]
MIRVTRSAVIDAPIERVWAVLRDFNSHTAWHPAIAESAIENGEPPDQVGCVRSFTLRDGNRIREQLLALSDAEHISTYCILDATLPLQRYVATVQLKRVTDGDRTFWHWQSTFDAPRGREREFTELVGKGVYEGGFEGLRTYLRRRPGTPMQRGAASGPAMATQGIVAARFGGPDVLELRPLAARAPGPGEVRIRHTAIGVNYIDVYVRKGQYRMIEPPAPLGMEAAGEVLEVGDGVAHLLPGDRVAYACAPPGAYVGVRTLAADHVVVLPDHVDDESAAALMLKGMTAEYLLHRTHRLRAGETVLVHAAAGGVGLLLCQWAKALGARVVGTVSTDAKARQARVVGCDAVIVGRDYRFAQAVRDATAGRGADVIYDGLGQAAARENLDALAMCGHWVSYGQASGPLERLSVDALGEKSATFSHPVLFHHTADRAALTQMASRVFDACRSGTLRLDIRHRYALAAAAQAHRDLEGRATTGPLILMP